MLNELIIKIRSQNISCYYGQLMSKRMNICRTGNQCNHSVFYTNKIQIEEQSKSIIKEELDIEILKVIKPLLFFPIHIKFILIG